MSRKALQDLNQVVPALSINMDTKGDNNKVFVEPAKLGRTRSKTKSMKREAPIDQEQVQVKKLKPEPEVKFSAEKNPTKRELADDEKDHVKKLKTEHPETENTNNGFINYVSDVLGKHYFNVVDRLNLHSTPECVTNLLKCTEKHSSNAKTDTGLYEFDVFLKRNVGEFVTDGKIELFYDLLSSIVMRGEFPGKDLLQLMLETMLAFNEPGNESCVDEFLDTGETIFVQVLQKFPPCWMQVRGNYLKLMKDPLQLESFKKKREFESKEGLFNLLILLLELNIGNGERAQRTKDRHELNNTMDMNFAKWEEYTKQTYDFSKNERDDRIGRVFRVLKLLVQLMEYDLALWMLKNPRNIHNGFASSEKKSLIASLLWPDRTCDVNFSVKRLIKLFIECVNLNYPNEDLAVLSRLLNLVASCINLSEIQTEKNHIVQFPSINNNSESFVKEFKRLIADNPHFTISLYINVLKHLRTPFVKALLAKQILFCLNPSKNSLKPGRDTPLHGLLSSLNTKEWRKMGSRPVSSDFSSAERYPINSKIPNTRKKSFDIYQEDFLFIQQTEFQSNIELYRTHDLYNTIRDPSNTPKQEISNYPQFSTFNIEMLESQVISEYKPESTSTALPKNNIAQFIFKSINIKLDMVLFYREQIKLCYYLQRFIDKAAVKYPELTEFQTYLNKTLQKY